MGILVKNIMKKQIISIDSSLKAKDAAVLMDDSGVSCLVVMEKNVPVGMLTERDFVTKVSALGKYSSTSIREIMSMPLITINPDATVAKLTELMSDKKIHKVPVVEGNKLLGIVTATDLIRKCIMDSDLDLRHACSAFAQMAF